MAAISISFHHVNRATFNFSTEGNEGKPWNPRLKIENKDGGEVVIYLDDPTDARIIAEAALKALSTHYGEEFRLPNAPSVSAFEDALDFLCVRSGDLDEYGDAYYRSEMKAAIQQAIADTRKD